MGSEPSIERLIERARQSTTGEAFQQVMKVEHYRAGIVVNVPKDGTPVISIELLLQVFDHNSTVDPLFMEKAARVVRALNNMGYLVAHEDDGWLLCKKTIDDGGPYQEVISLRSMLEEYYHE